MERSYRVSNGIYFYATFLLFDALILAWEAVARFDAGAPLWGAILAGAAGICLFLAAVLVWRWGTYRVVITPEALLIRGERPPRRIYWTDVDRVREIHGPPYELSLKRLLPGPFLPHGIWRGETVLEIVARPAMRIVLRRALVEGYSALRQDVLRCVPRDAEVDLHGRWWRD